MKKLIALLLVFAFVCAGTVGCTSSTSPATTKPAAGGGSGDKPK